MATKDGSYQKNKESYKEKRPPVKGGSIQDAFFNQWRKERAFITIYLINGIKLMGRIKSFDRFTVIIENRNMEQMIFKHAISTVSSSKPYGEGYSDYRSDSGPNSNQS
ncbi:RNA chaperone Hfq [Acidobacteriota bacterium]